MGNPRLFPPMENMMIWDRKGKPHLSPPMENMTIRLDRNGDPSFVSNYGKHDDVLG